MKPWWLRPLTEGDENGSGEESSAGRDKAHQDKGGGDSEAPSAKESTAPKESAAPKKPGSGARSSRAKSGDEGKSRSKGEDRQDGRGQSGGKEAAKETPREAASAKSSRSGKGAESGKGSDKASASAKSSEGGSETGKSSEAGKSSGGGQAKGGQSKGRGRDSAEEKTDRGGRGRRGRGAPSSGGPRFDEAGDDEDDRRFDRNGAEEEETDRNGSSGDSYSSERSQSVNDERRIALFCDLENIALGVRDSKEVKKFDIALVLTRLVEKGKIIVKKAYCDWERYSEFKRPFHEAAIEMIDIPQKYYSGKNSADIKMVVDAMDYCYSKEHLDTFCVMSGDSDFSPLVSKLKENNKYVIGVGVKGASSNLLIANCDEFIYYEDVWRDQQQSPLLDGLTKKQSEAFSQMIDAIQALLRENKDVLWGSMIKQTMQRKKPSFNEGYYGYDTFSALLEDAEDNEIVKLKKDRRSGSYIVTGFASKRDR